MANIDTVFNLGEDAFANLFEISFTPPNGIVNQVGAGEMQIARIKGFEIPDTGVETYEVNYKTQSFTRVTAKVDAPNEFTFDIRIDRNYLMYKTFVNWKNSVINTETGQMGEDTSLDSGLRTTVSVWPVQANNTGQKNSDAMQWKFIGCICTNVSGISFDHDSGDPLEATITMNFVKMQEQSA